MTFAQAITRLEDGVVQDPVAVIVAMWQELRRPPNPRLEVLITMQFKATEEDRAIKNFVAKDAEGDVVDPATFTVNWTTDDENVVTPIPQDDGSVKLHIGSPGTCVVGIELRDKETNVVEATDVLGCIVVPGDIASVTFDVEGHEGEAH